MSFLDWAEASLCRIRTDGVRGGYQSVHELYLGGLRRFARLTYYNPEYIWERDWDLLIVLDACRYDLMEEVVDGYPYITDLGSLVSVASSTTGWSESNFDEQFSSQLANTAYITGNPNSVRIAPHEYPERCDCRATVEPSYDDIYHEGTYQCDQCNTRIDGTRVHPFGRLEEVWRTEWNEEFRTIRPDPVTQQAITVARTGDFDRMIVHYNQPHHPFIPDPVGAGSNPHKRSDTGRSVWDRLRDREVDADRVWNAYRENLRYVLDRLPNLLGNIDADKPIITADHGNAIGEHGLYGHPRATTPIDALVKVPWCETTATDEGTIETDEEDLTDEYDTADANVQQRLRDLGYKA